MLVWSYIITLSILMSVSIGFERSITKYLRKFFIERTFQTNFHRKKKILDFKLFLSENPSIIELLDETFKKGLIDAFPELSSSIENVNTLIVPGKVEFGDYQCNVAMQLTKVLKIKPNEIAENLVIHMKSNESIIDYMDITGPGFINIRISKKFIKSKLFNMLQPITNGNDAITNTDLDFNRVGIKKITDPQNIIVDFSSPNIAKEMHVGHLRSTIIGDCISKVLEFKGHNVLRLNHVGDWGTQFGMLIHYLKTNHHLDISTDDNNNKLNVEIGDLVEFYKAAKKCFDEDVKFQEASRYEVVMLQSGNPQSIRAWQVICQKSRIEFQSVYDKLNIKLNERGESFYNPFLPKVVSDLVDAGLVVDSQGAKCIFLEGYKNSDGTPLPLIVQKNDSGYLYATTDLAALQHRINVEKASRIIYVTDAGQAQHFEMVFKVANLANSWSSAAEVDLVHVPFGLVQGEDGKKIKSRAGDSVKLRELLDEAINIAEENERNRMQEQYSKEEAANSSSITFSDELKKRSRIIGIGAVKYADLSMNRESNYRFSFNKMLALSGNTAPYMLYAYVRIYGIQRKAAQSLLLEKNLNDENISDNFDFFAMKKELCMKCNTYDKFVLEDSNEITLAKHIIKFNDVLQILERDLYPNKLCDYIFELSQKFNQFYEHCPVLKAGNSDLRLSRTALCVLTADILKVSLDLLGIETVDKL